MKFERQLQLHLESPGEIRYWAERWGVSQGQLKDAIISTGSISLPELRNYLREKGFLPALPPWLRNLSRKINRNEAK